MNFCERMPGANRWCWAWVIALSFLVVPGFESASAQVIELDELEEIFETPLLEQEPFDLIFLDDYNRNAVMRIVPLKEPIKKPYPEDGFFVFEFSEDNENLLQVPWSRVVDYRSYRTLVRNEADKWFGDKDYGNAFRNYLYLYDRGGQNDDDIVQALRTVLFQDGVESFRAAMAAVERGEDADGKFELALSIFEDIYSKDPNFKVPGLSRTLIEIIMSCYEGIVQGYDRKGDYEMIRGILTQVSLQYEEKADALIARWRKIFEQKSDRLLADAEKFAGDGDGLAAHAAVRKANSIFPDRKVTLEVYSRIVDKFPLVLVGVTQNGLDADVKRLEHWGARRVGKMTQRSIVEFDGLGDEGGKYAFLNGTVSQIDDVGLEYRFELTDDQKFGVPSLSAWELAQRLQSFADPKSSNYKITWAKIVDSVAIENETQVRFKLKMPFVRPEALLQFPYQDTEEGKLPDQNGKYVLKMTEGDLATYEPNPNYTRNPDRQYPTIIEQEFRNASDAVDALMKGTIDVLDRVPIPDIQKLRRDKSIQVRPYTVPTVHMLVPNLRNEFVQDRNFRSGLLRGINRNLIVTEMICKGEEISGCEPISGPLPRGTDENDQLGYGYNGRVKTLPYNDRLGMVLVQLIKERLEAKEREAGNSDPKIVRPPMVLVYPDDEVAAIACTTIARMWREIGVKTNLKRLPPGVTVPEDEKWDFLYLAASMEEPLVDIDKIIGKTGYAKDITAPVAQQLKNLSYSNSWQSSSSTLRRIHRQVSNDVSVLPLWQLTEFYAHRLNVTETGRQLTHLYKNVDRWRIYPIDDEALEQKK